MALDARGRKVAQVRRASMTVRRLLAGDVTFECLRCRRTFDARQQVAITIDGARHRLPVAGAGCDGELRVKVVGRASTSTAAAVQPQQDCRCAGARHVPPCSYARLATAAAGSERGDR